MERFVMTQGKINLNPTLGKKKQIQPILEKDINSLNT
jgi:hypothetical protein